MKFNFFIVFLIFNFINADEHTHIYSNHEQVVLWMNTVGPYDNRQETYPYFSLPFCRGKEKEIGHYHETMGEALLGVELEFSGLDIKFKEILDRTEYCKTTLTQENYNMLGYAVRNKYWYQMYADDLPIWGTIGEVKSDGDIYIWTHKIFNFSYNGNQIIEVSFASNNRKKLEPEITLKFTYEVNWIETKQPFEKRFDKYLDSNFFQHRIHWFSIFNSFMMVLFLVGLVFLILMRTLRKDYARYRKDEELNDFESDLGDEYGWKQVHGDVFRPPFNASLFSSLVGTGAHLTLVTVVVVILAILAKLYVERGSLLSTAIFIYSVSTPVNGFVGGAAYSKMGGKRWVKQAIIGAFLFPTLVSSVAFLINFIAVYIQTSRAIPFILMLAILSICLFIVLPLNIIGAVLGRNMIGQPNNPCRINAVPRPIPEKKWFLDPIIIVFLGGILPFGSIFIEMYFIFTSFWAYKIYFVFGFALLVLIILFIVTICVTIVCTYFLLNAEDYRWQWTSFLVGSSTAFYVYMYSIFYFLFKTKMFGLFQTTFYFSYMALFCFALALICGSVGYYGANRFVHKIYSTVKID